MIFDLKDLNSIGMTLFDEYVDLSGFDKKKYRYMYSGIYCPSLPRGAIIEKIDLKRECYFVVTYWSDFSKGNPPYDSHLSSFWIPLEYITKSNSLKDAMSYYLVLDNINRKPCFLI